MFPTLLITKNKLLGKSFNSEPQFTLLGVEDPSDCLISHSSSAETPRCEQIKRAFEKYRELHSRHGNYYCYLDVEIREGEAVQ